MLEWKVIGYVSFLLQLHSIVCCRIHVILVYRIGFFSFSLLRSFQNFLGMRQILFEIFAWNSDNFILLQRKMKEPFSF